MTLSDILTAAEKEDMIVYYTDDKVLRFVANENSTPTYHDNDFINITCVTFISRIVDKNATSNELFHLTEDDDGRWRAGCHFCDLSTDDESVCLSNVKAVVDLYNVLDAINMGLEYLKDKRTRSGMKDRLFLGIIASFAQNEKLYKLEDQNGYAD